MSRLQMATALAAAAFPLAATAGGIERSVPSSRVLFEEGRYLEFSFSTANPSLSGTGGSTAPLGGSTPAAPNGTGDLFDSFVNLGAAYKADVSDRLSYAIVASTPWGVDTAYPTVATSVYSGTIASLDGVAVDGMLAYDVTENIKVYGGLRLQSIEANAEIPFVFGYSVDADRDWSTGYLVGAAYSIPDIAFRVALTYYSAIDHELETLESNALATNFASSVDIETPEQINLEFQTGIAPDTLLFGGIRWVNWSEFAIAPTLYTNTLGSPLVDYEEDWTTYTLGVGRRFSEQFAASVSVSHEPAADYVPLTTLGPVDGRTSVNLGGTYTIDNVDLTAGVSYTWLGDTRNVLGTSFEDGDALGFGFRIGYHF